MGILTRAASAKSARSAVTIIAEGNKFTGEMSIVGKLHIDGIFEGNISSLDSISIGKRGAVHGNIRAHQINVCGLLQGEIHCDELSVENGGKVRGTVYSEHMVIEREGCFIGERRLKEGASAQEGAPQYVSEPARSVSAAKPKRGSVLETDAWEAEAAREPSEPAFLQQAEERSRSIVHTFYDLPDKVTLADRQQQPRDADSPATDDQDQRTG